MSPKQKMKANEIANAGTFLLVAQSISDSKLTIFYQCMQERDKEKKTCTQWRVIYMFSVVNKNYMSREQK